MSLAYRSTEIEYPSSDGERMAENTLQFEWIVAIKGSLERIFRNDPQVFVAGDLLWYPVQGNNKIRVAPDALVAFGRPKGYRGAYLQWLENDIPPQVVFEVLSLGNRAGEMTRKFDFYNRYGVSEYYLIDPDRHTVDGWVRDGDSLREIPVVDGWTSPQLGISFQVAEGESVRLLQPNGTLFHTYLEVCDEVEQSQLLVKEASARMELEITRAEREKARAERLATKLRELGVDPSDL